MKSSVCVCVYMYVHLSMCHHAHRRLILKYFTCDAPGVQGICVPTMSSSNREGCVKLSMVAPPSVTSPLSPLPWQWTG